MKRSLNEAVGRLSGAGFARLPTGEVASIRVLRMLRRRGREAEGGGLLNRYTL